MIRFSAGESATVTSASTRGLQATLTVTADAASRKAEYTVLLRSGGRLLSEHQARVVL